MHRIGRKAGAPEELLGASFGMTPGPWNVAKGVQQERDAERMPDVGRNIDIAGYCAALRIENIDALDGFQVE